MKQLLGHPRLHLRICASTNAVAKQLAENGAPHGTTVTAREQTAGRGRQGRSWVAPPGEALLMSTVVRPVSELHKLAPLAVALAVAETCEQLTDVHAQIKWPNDVWLDGRKVAGILVEARPDHETAQSWLVAGVGLNTTLRVEDLPQELHGTATTLGLPPDCDALAPLLAHLDRWLGAESALVVNAWRGRDALFGRRIGWSEGENECEAVADGIDDAGNLVVEQADGSRRSLSAGEVHLALPDPI